MEFVDKNGVIWREGDKTMMTIDFGFGDCTINFMVVKHKGELKLIEWSDGSDNLEYKDIETINEAGLQKER